MEDVNILLVIVDELVVGVIWDIFDIVVDVLVGGVVVFGVVSVGIIDIVDVVIVF